MTWKVNELSRESKLDSMILTRTTTELDPAQLAAALELRMRYQLELELSPAVLAGVGI